MKTKLLLILLILNGCNNSLYRVMKSNPAPGLEYSYNNPYFDISYSNNTATSINNSFEFINEDGQEITFNQGVVDTESGQLVSLRHLDQVVVSAKSNNIAERNGLIKLSFMITVPSLLQNSDWQTQMVPILRRGKDTTHFKKIILSGKEFKRAQERGYKKFESYLKSIIPDDANFLEEYSNLHDLIIFLERNLPHSLAIYGSLNDSLKTEFGVTEQRIIKQYLKRWLISKNNRRKKEKNNKYNKYVKNPYLTGARLDSIICNKDGDFEYHYAQEIFTNENSSRLNLWIASSIRDVNGTEVQLRASDTITYNVSSMSGLVQDNIRFKKKVTERRVQLSFDANISFPVGKWDITPTFRNNKAQIEQIDSIFYDIFSEKIFDLDSLFITSFASPEGRYQSNQELSNKRAFSIKSHLYESINRASQNLMTIDITNHTSEESANILKIDNERIITTSIPEDWDNLFLLIKNDTVIKNRESVLQTWAIENLDKREEHIKLQKKNYGYIRDSLYPKLRRVSFRLNLLRKGMIKDTIHTNEPDTLYMKGIELLKKREYISSLGILSDYNDINAAIAHMSLGHDNTALQILEQAPTSAKQVYMLAILYARKGFEEKASKYFLKSKEMDIRMAYRGGLDPEINYLINKYNLNKDLFE